MIITISGGLGSGKSTVAKLVAKKLNYKHYSTGDFMRKMALERNITILKLSKLAENDKNIDKELDERQIKFGKEHDNFVIDSRLGWYFIPKSIKVFLKVDDKIAAERIFKNKREDERNNSSLKQTEENIKRRLQSEIKRYREYYNLDYHNEKNYDLIVDTNKIPAKEVVEKILNHIKKLKNKQQDIT